MSLFASLLTFGPLGVHSGSDGGSCWGLLQGHGWVDDRVKMCGAAADSSGLYNTGLLAGSLRQAAALLGPSDTRSHTSLTQLTSF